MKSGMLILEIFFISLLYFFMFDYFFFFIVSFLGSVIIMGLSLGVPLFILNSPFIVLVFMSVMILGVVFLSENNIFLSGLSSVLVLLSILFFFSSNIFYVYLFFEISGFPIAIMILSYGYQIEKMSSAYYLFFYTFICSLPFFMFIFNMDMNSNVVFFIGKYSWEMTILLFILFLVKFPVYFFHLWLPKAHVEAPTTASMLLAGLLLKLGTGGFLRLLEVLNFVLNSFLLIISFLGMLVSGVICILQSDLKALAAFSSINHMSFVLLVLSGVSSVGVWGSLVIMLSHGLVSTLMFFFIGEFYHLSGTRLVYYFNSSFTSGVYLVVLMALTWLYNGGVPMSISFFSEYSGMTTLFSTNSFYFLGLFFFF